MEALFPTVYQRRNGQLHGLVDGVLLLHRHLVGLHQSEVEGGHILVAHTVPVQWIETNPRPHFRPGVTKDQLRLPVTQAQLLDELPGGAVPVALLGHESAVLLPGFGDIAHQVAGVKQGFQIGGELLRRVSQGTGEGLPLQPVPIDHHELVPLVADFIVPVKGFAPVDRIEAVAFGQLHDGAPRHRRSGVALKAAPLLLALPGAVTVVRAAPLVPDGPVVALGFQGHAHLAPLVVIQLTGRDAVQSL